MLVLFILGYNRYVISINRTYNVLYYRMKKLVYSVSSIAGLFPVAAFAQYNQVNTSFVDSVINLINKLISFAFPALTAIAVIVFIVMLIKYINADSAAKEKDRKGLVYALVALFIIVSLFGILKVMQNITGTGGNNTIDATQVPRVDLSF